MRTDQEALLHAYLNGYEKLQANTVNEGRKKISSSAATGAQAMNQTGRISIPKSYDPVPALVNMAVQQNKNELAEAERQRKTAASAAKKAQKEAEKRQEQQNALNNALNWWDSLQQPGSDADQLSGGTTPPVPEKSSGFFGAVKDTVKSMFTLGAEGASDKLQGSMPGGNVPSILGPQNAKIPVPDKKPKPQKQQDRNKESSSWWDDFWNGPQAVQSVQNTLPGGNIASMMGVRPEPQAPDLPQRSLAEQMELYSKQAAEIQSLQDALAQLDRDRVTVEDGMSETPTINGFPTIPSLEPLPASLIDTSQKTIEKKQEMDRRRQELLQASDKAQQQLAQYDKGLHAIVAQLPQEEQLEVWLMPGYKLNERERAAARRIGEEGRKRASQEYAQLMAQGADPFSKEGLAKQEESLLYDQLLNKTNIVGAFADHAADAIPFFTRAADGAIETQRKLYGLNETYPIANFQQTLDQQQTQSPAASTAGKVAGTMAEYMVGSQLMKSLPGVGKALGKAGQAVAGTQAAQAFQQIPVLGHLATADAVSGILGDQILDTAFDTIPSLYDDIQTYRTQGEDGDLSVGDILGNTAKNVGFNFGMNLLGEGVQGALQSRAARKAAEQRARLEYNHVLDLDDLPVLKSQNAPVATGAETVLEKKATIPTLQDNAAFKATQGTSGAQPLPHLEATGDAFWSGKGAFDVERMASQQARGLYIPESFYDQAYLRRAAEGAKPAPESVPSLKEADALKAADAPTIQEVYNLPRTVEGLPSFNDGNKALMDAADVSFQGAGYSGKRVTRTKDPLRNLESAAKDPASLTTARAGILEPMENARANYANNTINALESLEQAMNKFDIPKGSVYDQAVSWVLQGSKEVDGKPVAYGLEQLKAEFPKDWEDISKAAEYGRGLLDQYYQRMVVMNENLGYSIPEYKPGFMPGASQRAEGGAGVLNDLAHAGKAQNEGFIESAIDYIQRTERRLAFRPVVENTDRAISQLEAAGGSPQFVRWLREWNENISTGATPLGRIFDNADLNPWFRFADRLNNRAKANAVVGNISSAINQFANIPNATAYLKNPVDWARGIAGYGNAILDPTSEIAQAMRQSGFLQERYGIGKALNAFDTGLLNKPRKFLNWMLTFGDEQAARSIWATAYESAQRRGLENAVRYADDITKKAVAGRGIGDVPLVQQERITKVLAPFQVEVNNSWNLIREKLGQKDAVGLINLAATSYMFNNLVESVTGNRPLPDLVEAVQGGMQESEGQSDLKRAAAIGGRAAGEIISAMPYGAMIGSMLTGGDSALGEKLFGDSDPTRFGTGVVGPTSAIVPLAQLATGKTIDPVPALLKTALPVGGNQLSKTVGYLQDQGQLPQLGLNIENGLQVTTNQFPASYTPNGKLRFAYDHVPSLLDYAQGAAFGRYATPEGRAYIENGASPYSQKATDAVRDGYLAGIAPNTTLDIYNAFKDIDNAKTVDQLRQAVGNVPAPSSPLLRAYQKAVNELQERENVTGSSANELKRQLLLAGQGLTPDQKATLDKLLINDVIVMPQDKNVNYESSETFNFTNLPESQQERYSDSFGLSKQQWAAMYNIMAAAGPKKVDKVASLLAIGCPEDAANTIYRLMYGKK